MTESLDEKTERLTIGAMVHHDKLYEIGVPVISDVDYDQLKTECRSLYPNNPYFATVGASSDTNKYKLPVTLGSLNKVKADGSCQMWLESTRSDKGYVYWAKLDGVSCLVCYVEGAFDRAYTRGDGLFGTDITEKIRNVVPARIPKGTTGMYRGEVMLTGHTHIDMGYKTRRNGAAGILNRDDGKNKEGLEVLFYELVEDSGYPSHGQTMSYVDEEMSRIDRLKELGFPLAPYKFGTVFPVEKIVELLREWKTDFPFDIDGVVITANDSVREDTFYPDDKVAFKQNEDAVPVTVLSVEWNVGRTGKITPTVLLEPTAIQGVTVERSSGFNAAFIRDNQIKGGTVVRIMRSGDVIPYIDSVDWD